MISDLASIAYSGYIIHVTFYANAAAIILSLGVMVLCSRGIIRDPFEEKLFRWLLLATFCMSVINGLAFIGIDAVLPLFLSMLIQTINDLLLSIVVILWMCYVDYRIYRSRDHIIRSYLKKIIPLFIIVALTIITLFTGLLYHIDADHNWHVTWGQALCETVRFFYLVACVIKVAGYKKKHREFKFFTVAGFVLPVVAGLFFTAYLPYSLVPLGFAIGLTNVYAGIINETSFLDRDTGYYNRFYMKYLEADIRNNVIPVKSVMTYSIEDPKDMEEFSKVLSPILPGKCVMIRYNPVTVMMLAEVSDRFALRMMDADVKEGIKTLDIPLRVDTFIRKKAEPAPEFFEKLLQQIDGENQGAA